MLIHQISTPSLGDHSYVVRCGRAGCVVDPQRDLDRFHQAFAALGVPPVAVLETHVHNDYLSGGPALAHHYGCEYRVPAHAGYEMPHRRIRDGEELRIGEVVIRAAFTPGHTPHHMSYQVLQKGQVRAVFSGGCVLVGACGRTDLTSHELTEELTRKQYRSARRIGRLPDPTAIGPTHGAGSFCAASAPAGETWTTVAQEKTRNPALLMSEDGFVEAQLSGLLAYPAYYARMGRLNQRGAAGWTGQRVPGLDPQGLARLQTEDVTVIDCRPRRAFAEGHIPGSANVELDSSFATYLGWLFPADARFALVLDAGQDASDAVRQCARIGVESIEGVLAGGLDAWRRAGGATSGYRVADVEEMKQALVAGGARALDVRQDAEWRAGHVPGAVHIHIAELPARTGELGRDATVYVYCRSGHRAAIGASLLQTAEIPVVAVDGGFPDWRDRGYPVARPSS